MESLVSSDVSGIDQYPKGMLGGAGDVIGVAETLRRCEIEGGTRRTGRGSGRPLSFA